MVASLAILSAIRDTKVCLKSCQRHSTLAVESAFSHATFEDPSGTSGRTLYLI